MAGLPFLKLFTLVIKTVAKPVASRVKIEARKHKQLSTVCINIGQLSHQIVSRINVIASGYKVITINPLPDDEALNQGVDFLSESIIFLIGGGVILLEFFRNEKKNQQKALQQEEETREFRQSLEDRFSSLDAKIGALNERLALMETIQSQPQPIANKDQKDSKDKK